MRWRTRLSLLLLLLLGLGISLPLAQIRFEKPGGVSDGASINLGALTLSGSVNPLLQVRDGSANDWITLDTSNDLARVKVGYHTFTYVTEAGAVMEEGVLAVQPTWSPSSNSSKSLTAVGGNVTTAGSNTLSRIIGVAAQGTHNGTNTLTNLIGMRAVASMGASSGNVTNAKVIWGVLQNTGSNTITDGRALEVYVNKFNSGPITNGVGVYIASGFSGVTNKWGLYVEDTSALNYFGHNVGVKVTSPAHRLDVALGTITSQSAVLNAIGTWNSGGTTFTALKLNITDTASASASLLLDLQVGGSSKWAVTKAGAVTQAAGLTLSSGVLVVPDGAAAAPSLALSGNTFEGFFYGNGTFQWTSASAGRMAFKSGGFQQRSDMEVRWAPSSDPTSTAPDVRLAREAAGVLALRNTSNAQTFQVYGTYTDASNYVGGTLGASSTLVTLAAITAGSGADNVNINLDPAGTGTVQIDGTDGVSGTCSAVTVVKGIVTGCTP
jgi:hypothetical protein